MQSFGIVHPMAPELVELLVPAPEPPAPEPPAPLLVVLVLVEPPLPLRP
jgi:hypothetical protein